MPLGCAFGRRDTSAVVLADAASWQAPTAAGSATSANGSDDRRRVPRGCSQMTVEVGGRLGACRPSERSSPRRWSPLPCITKAAAGRVRDMSQSDRKTTGEPATVMRTFRGRIAERQHAAPCRRPAAVATARAEIWTGSLLYIAENSRGTDSVMTISTAVAVLDEGAARGRVVQGEVGGRRGRRPSAARCIPRRSGALAESSPAASRIALACAATSAAFCSVRCFRYQ